MGRFKFVCVVEGEGRWAAWKGEGGSGERRVGWGEEEISLFLCNDNYDYVHCCFNSRAVILPK